MWFEASNAAVIGVGRCGRRFGSAVHLLRGAEAVEAATANQVHSLSTHSLTLRWPASNLTARRRISFYLFIFHANAPSAAAIRGAIRRSQSPLRWRYFVESGSHFSFHLLLSIAAFCTFDIYTVLRSSIPLRIELRFIKYYDTLLCYD